MIAKQVSAYGTEPLGCVPGFPMKSGFKGYNGLKLPTILSRPGIIKITHWVMQSWSQFEDKNPLTVVG
jgi:hypothetical protein